ncbi:hypothetical protein DM860_012324 [Cuscuta australis]|uniref:RING-type domain-containing protein n=1 Tax=Cuscuta australis TaxID=267555 RepID=A0A328DTI4_9ASTE|nr:hypothetical protein DM860_012324 [Cuscuta australis]
MHRRGEVEAMAANQVVKVRREAIASCMTCPLCHRLFREATTISECLHTFCRKCIYKKLQDEETECCPICNIELGCVPVEKLRANHSLQDVRLKIFPYKRQKVTMAAEIVLPSVTTLQPVRRKERSLSSLVVSTPSVSCTQTGGMTGRRSKSVARKPMKGSSFPIEKPLKNEECSSFPIEKPLRNEECSSFPIEKPLRNEECSSFPIEKNEEKSTEDQPAESSSSPETLNKFTQNKSSSNAKPSGQDQGGTENNSEQCNGKADLLKPLSCLGEAAKMTEPSRSTLQGCAQSEPTHLADNEGQAHKVKLNIYNIGNGNHAHPVSENPKKIRRVRKKASNSGDFGVSPQAVVDATTAISETRAKPIWFSLVASANQEGEAPLPQISASYLRIKDGSIPVSYIQKYLMRKLDLKSEGEVEIRCMGKSIAPTLQLKNLVDLWLEMTTPERVSAAIGSSAKDFVMMLAYGRHRAQPPGAQTSEDCSFKFI